MEDNESKKRMLSEMSLGNIVDEMICIAVSHPRTFDKALPELLRHPTVQTERYQILKEELGRREREYTSRNVMYEPFDR